MFPASEVIPLCVGFSLLALLLVSSVTDLAWHRIPNLLLLSALLVAMMLRISDEGVVGIMSAVSGLVVGLAFLMPLYAMGSMGAGDVKLLGVVGVFLGPWGAFIAGIATLIAGAILGLVYIAWRIFEPFLAHHSWRLMRLFYAEGQMVPAPSYEIKTTRGSKIAYAPAIAGGAIFSMWQQGLLTQLAIVS